MIPILYLVSVTLIAAVVARFLRSEQRIDQALLNAAVGCLVGGVVGAAAGALIDVVQQSGTTVQTLGAVGAPLGAAVAIWRRPCG